MPDDLIMRISLASRDFQPQWHEGCRMEEILSFDYDRLYDFEMEHFRDAPNYHYTPRDEWIGEVKNWLKTDPSVHWYLAYHDRTIIGSLTAWRPQDQPRTYYIQAMLVAREWRRKGVASAMLNQFFSLMKKLRYLTVFLRVHKDNLPAIELYRKAGMEIVE